MRKCRSKRCDYKVKAGWNFCPSCGRDNRPKEFRPTIITCGHRYVGPKNYCVVCGLGYGTTRRAESTDANIRSGIWLVMIGAGLLAGSWYVSQVMAVGSGEGFHWIQSWYRRSFDLPLGFSVRGDQLPAYAQYAGGAFVFLGLLAVMVAAMNRPVAAKPPGKRKKKKKKKKEVIGGTEGGSDPKSGGLDVDPDAVRANTHLH